jgi:hypothetical protein
MALFHFLKASLTFMPIFLVKRISLSRLLFLSINVKSDQGRFYQNMKTTPVQIEVSKSLSAALPIPLTPSVSCE